jgi:hypothetical protein
MTTTGFLDEVSTKELGRRETTTLRQQEYGFPGQRDEENSLAVIRSMANRVRCVPVRWLISPSREIPVIRDWDMRVTPLLQRNACM